VRTRRSNPWHAASHRLQACSQRRTADLSVLRARSAQTAKANSCSARRRRCAMGDGRGPPSLHRMTDDSVLTGALRVPRACSGALTWALLVLTDRTQSTRMDFGSGTRSAFMQYYGYPHGVLGTPACITLSSRIGLSGHWHEDHNRVMCVLTSGTKRLHRDSWYSQGVTCVLAWGLQEGGT
jgi:hypothetical protein